MLPLAIIQAGLILALFCLAILQQITITCNKSALLLFIHILGILIIIGNKGGVNVNKTVVIVGLIILAVISFMWTLGSNEIEVGKHVPSLGDYPNRGEDTYYPIGNAGRAQGETWEGLSPEAAAEKRAKINTLYGLWFVLTLAGTIMLGFESKNAVVQYDITGTEEAIYRKLHADYDDGKDGLTVIDNYDVCPFCFEKIKAKALKCKHCHSLINQKESC